MRLFTFDIDYTLSEISDAYFGVNGLPSHDKARSALFSVRIPFIIIEYTKDTM